MAKACVEADREILQYSPCRCLRRRKDRSFFLENCVPSDVCRRSYGYAMGPAKARRPTDTVQGASSLQGRRRFADQSGELRLQQGALYCFFPKQRVGAYPEVWPRLARPFYPMALDHFLRWLGSGR